MSDDSPIHTERLIEVPVADCLDFYSAKLIARGEIITDGTRIFTFTEQDHLHLKMDGKILRRR